MTNHRPTIWSWSPPTTHFFPLTTVVRFVDSYWDSHLCVLASSDCWLRRRESKWELKVPAGAAAQSGGERTSFTEIVGAKAVAQALVAKALVPESASDVADEDALEALLREAGLEPFAELETTRTKFQVPLEGPSTDGCLVDADVARSRLQPDWAHSVVEVR